MRIGLDIGSTTIKCVVLDDQNHFIYQSYERHFSQIIESCGELLAKIRSRFPDQQEAYLAISGSAGIGIAERTGIPFVQEVYAARMCVNRLLPGTDVVIELGGEDAKILFLTNGLEVRMNGSCAGGTGAFIDQMASLLNVTPEELDTLAKQKEKIYTIASRCGVFAKTDIQPLLNQGARKPDIAASIYSAVVSQTIAGLAQGREIKGNIVYLGGPLTFSSSLRESFDEALHTKGVCPENSLYYVAIGAAFCADQPIDLAKASASIAHYQAKGNFSYRPPLFASEAEYQAFLKRHSQCAVAREDLASYNGKAYVGIDAGSTTVKAVVMGENGALLHEVYLPNSGNPVPLIRTFLTELYEKKPDIDICASAVTGYGEELIRSAFCADYGIVETVAHFNAAKSFLPDVEFVIDIGGQDIKCFKIHNGAIDNIFLNEACSSGCGSFLQTFANALHYSPEEFSKLGLLAKKPVDLGSRCTVFMNSSVKQAQKDGASIEDISAGLSLAVVKNALYKVIRASSPGELGKKIVVQGGTFLNDAVLRAFEQEIGTEVIRPDISGLMGAYGAALYARQKAAPGQKSAILDAKALAEFTHEIRVVTCGLCNNHCRLTVNTFQDGRKFIGGNRCERPVTKAASSDDRNLYAYKRAKLSSYKDTDGSRGVIGIPMGLNMYELFPFWYTFFTKLSFGVRRSPISSRALYVNGQQTIPSDTVCYPAKLMHGHVQALVDEGIDTIFYPCMSYNFDEHLGDNHYNCPVVAYYPEVIGANMASLQGKTLIKDYVGIHRKKDFPVKMHAILSNYFSGITLDEVRKAAACAYAEYDAYLADIRQKGEEMIAQARKENRQIIVLSGRPYHVDPEINHGIDKLITSFGATVISEDVLSAHMKKTKRNVLNQWTYHARLYAAADYVSTQPDMELVQLVSFGCGVDAITTDEVRDILERNGKIYTQIKIDEISNLGAVTIRLRSLFAAIGR